MGGRLAVDVTTGAGGAVAGVVSRDRSGAQTLHDADAVILAISIACVPCIAGAWAWAS